LCAAADVFEITPFTSATRSMAREFHVHDRLQKNGRNWDAAGHADAARRLKAGIDASTV
jgi:hypothetical protein